MSGLLINLLTFVESVTCVFGIRIIYEQPAYSVEKVLSASVEIRRYETTCKRGSSGPGAPATATERSRKKRILREPALGKGPGAPATATERGGKKLEGWRYVKVTNRHTPAVK